jgi:hypothetical protein
VRRVERYYWRSKQTALLTLNCRWNTPQWLLGTEDEPREQENWYHGFKKRGCQPKLCGSSHQATPKNGTAGFSGDLYAYFALSKPD